MPGPGLEEVTPGGGDTRSSALSPFHGPARRAYVLWVMGFVLCGTVRVFIIILAVPSHQHTLVETHFKFKSIREAIALDGKGRATCCQGTKGWEGTR